MDIFCEFYADFPNFENLPLIVVGDNSEFMAEDFDNFLWVTFTRSNPAVDVYGVRSFLKHKHWGCKGPMVIDARIKSHHAPVLEADSVVAEKVSGMPVLKKII